MLVRWLVAHTARQGSIQWRYWSILHCLCCRSFRLPSQASLLLPWSETGKSDGRQQRIRSSGWFGLRQKGSTRTQDLDILWNAWVHSTRNHLQYRSQYRRWLLVTRYSDLWVAFKAYSFQSQGRLGNLWGHFARYSQVTWWLQNYSLSFPSVCNSHTKSRARPNQSSKLCADKTHQSALVTSAPALLTFASIDGSK